MPGRRTRRRIIWSAHYDLPAGEPTVVEFEDEFPKNSTITLLPCRLKLGGFVNIGRDKLMQRVGLALQTVEIAGLWRPEWPPRCSASCSEAWTSRKAPRSP